MPLLRCVILDDYQNVALRSADWSSLSILVELTVLTIYFREAVEDIAAFIAGQPVRQILQQQQH